MDYSIYMLAPHPEHLLRVSRTRGWGGKMAQKGDCAGSVEFCNCLLKNGFSRFRFSNVEIAVAMVINAKAISLK